MDLLPHIGIAPAFDGLEFDRPAFLHGFVEGANDADIAQSFHAGGFRLAVFQDAIRKVNEFRGELIAELVKFPVRIAIDGHFQDGGHGVVIGLDGAQFAFGADDFKIGGVFGAETGGEAGQAFPGKAERGGGHFLDAAEARIGAGGGKAKSLDGFIAKDVAGGVDAVDADVVERAAGVLPLGADISGVHLHGKNGIEDARFANFSGADDFDGFQVGALEVKAIGGHQLDVVLRAGFDDVMALVFGDGERFLAKHVDAGLSGANAIVRMQIVRQGDVHGIDGAAAQAEFVILVGETILDAVGAGELAQFGFVIGDEGNELGVFLRMRERGQDGVLGDVSQADDGVADFSK